MITHQDHKATLEWGAR